MENTKRVVVLNLPTEDKVNIFHDGTRMFNSFGLNPQTGHSINSSCEGRHVYLMSEEDEIKTDDWFIHNYSNPLFKATKVTIPDIGTKEYPFNSLLPKGHNLFKIIASTDKSLGLPDIPTRFLTEYVGGGGGINKIDIDILPLEDGDTEYKLILTDNNEVIVSHQKGYKYANGHTYSEYQERIERVVEAYVYNKFLKESSEDCGEQDRLAEAFKDGAEWYKNNFCK